MDSPNPNNPHLNDNSGRGYALSGKIMLTAIVVVFFLAILMVSLHLYARWYLLNSRRRRARHRRRSHLIFYVDHPSNPDGSAPVIVQSSGLDAAVLKTLPLFVYASDTHPDLSECAVCLSEFEENESGRTLPKCNHSFHIECIDMWFHSHSTCPLCRSPVEPVQPTKPSSEIGSTSAGSLVTCQHKDVASTSSFNATRKPSEFVGVRIEIPRRNGNFEDDSATDSPSSYRSPISRMLSFKRILNRERKGNASSPSSCSGCGSGGSWNESETEKAGGETTQSQHGKLGGDSAV